MTGVVKNIGEIEMFEDSGYSEGGDWMGEGRMYGTSYRGGLSNDGGSSYAGRGRGSNASRDSRGRYSSRGYSQNGYSYGDDAAEEMIEKAQDMLSEAENEEQKRAIKQLIRKLENM